MNLRYWGSGSVVVGISMFLVGLMFHVLGGYVAPDLELHYKNRDLFRDWNGWTSKYMMIHPFVYAPIFSAFFFHLRGASSLPAGISGGLTYGAGVFCVGSLPVFLLAFASFQVPVEVIATWGVQNLCQYLAAGITLSMVIGRMESHRSESQPMSSACSLWRRVNHHFIRILKVFAILYICVCVYFWAAQVPIILAPRGDITTTPEDMGMTYDRVPIPVLDGQDKEIGELDAFWVPVENPDAPVFLYLHGQDATIGMNLEHTQQFHQCGWNVLVVDSREFGESFDTEQPSEAKVYEDALAALKYLKINRGFASNKIFIYGHSLGGAVAIELATKPESSDTAGLIVESTFTSIQEMSGWKYNGWLKLLPVSILLSEKFDSLSKINFVQLPILFIHGDKDAKVPYEMTEKLYDAAPSPKRKCVIKEAGHVNCGSIDEVRYRQDLGEFVAACLKRAETMDTKGVAENKVMKGSYIPATAIDN